MVLSSYSSWKWDFLTYLKEFSYAHQGWIFFNQKYSKTIILWNIITNKKKILFEYILKCNWILWWQSYIFSIITPVFSVTWFFRNHNNMLICCSRKTYSYQCWKQCCLIFVIPGRFVHRDSLINKMFKRSAFIWNKNSWQFTWFYQIRSTNFPNYW